MPSVKTSSAAQPADTATPAIASHHTGAVGAAVPTESIGAFKSDEPGRWRALGRLDILDSEAEDPFESVVELVRQVLHVPICAVSLVDRHRQWFKSSRGLEVCETARDISFCTHALKDTVPYLVGDATTNPLFADNPLVTGGPKIRSYAGIPLTTAEGYNIGTLCAIDTVAREFSEREVAILTNFAKVVITGIELRHIAATDVLTGVMSRRAWIDCAEREVHRTHRNGSKLSVMLFDIDHFKAINDRFGHPAGDAVIKQIAQAGEKQLRKSDLFGRFGGEEFVVALPDTDLAVAMIVAERIRRAIAAVPIACAAKECCTVSIGVAELGDDEASLDLSLERADQAMYRAKKSGRNRIAAGDAAARTAANRAAA